MRQSPKLFCRQADAPTRLQHHESLLHGSCFKHNLPDIIPNRLRGADGKDLKGWNGCPV